MPKWSTTVSSLLGIAICGGVIWVAASSQPGSTPVNAAPSRTTSASAPTTTVVPPPSHKDTSETGQERVASQIPLPPVTAAHRDPVTAPPGKQYEQHHAPTAAPDYRGQTPEWAVDYPPAPGTSPRAYYLHCLRQAARHNAAKAELTCQYLADSL